MIYNGTYTLENVETKEHRTFEINTQSRDAKFAPGKRILSLLNGLNNDSDYKGFAFVNDDGTIKVWNNCKGKDGKKSHFEYYAALFQLLNVQEDEQENIKVFVELCNHKYSVLISKHCLRCNRKLTSPESIRLGVGPVCAGMEM